VILDKHVYEFIDGEAIVRRIGPKRHSISVVVGIGRFIVLPYISHTESPTPKDLIAVGVTKNSQVISFPEKDPSRSGILLDRFGPVIPPEVAWHIGFKRGWFVGVVATTILAFLNSVSGGTFIDDGPPMTFHACLEYQSQVSLNMFHYNRSI
jgi:hypothetical protein